MKVRGLFFLFFLSSWAATAQAQQAPGEPAVEAARVVSLREVLQRARNNPPSVLAALATLKRTRAEESYARGAYIPRVRMEGGYGINFNDQPYLPKRQADAVAMLTDEQAAAAGYGNLPTRFRSASQNVYGHATFDYALFDLARRYAVNSAELNSASQASAYAATQRAAIQAASELYLQALAAIALVQDAELTLERRQSQYEAIAGLTKAGIRPSVDATRAEIEAVGARYALETREIELAAASAALSVAMGDDPNSGARPAGFEESVLPPPLDPLKASAVAIEHRPEVRQLELALQSRRNDHRAAVNARIPTAGVIATTDVRNQRLIGDGNGYEGRFVSAAASGYIRWSALDPLVWRRASVTSRAIDEAQRQLEAMLLSVRAEVVDAAYQVQRARAMVDQATQVLAAAQAARTAQNERYRAGVASLLDLLDAEGVEQNARRQRIEAERDHRIARVRLLALCGRVEQLLN